MIFRLCVSLATQNRPSLLCASSSSFTRLEASSSCVVHCELLSKLVLSASSSELHDSERVGLKGSYMLLLSSSLFPPSVRDARSICLSLRSCLFRAASSRSFSTSGTVLRLLLEEGGPAFSRLECQEFPLELIRKLTAAAAAAEDEDDDED